MYNTPALVYYLFHQPECYMYLECSAFVPLLRYNVLFTSHSIYHLF